MASPIGPLVVAWNGIGVSVVEAGRTTLRSRRRTRPGPGAARSRPTACRRRLEKAIRRRLAGDRRVRIDLDLRGHTDFEHDVWHKALEIPRGEVRPYGWVAAEIGRPKAVRAVGTALGHNPVPLIVPCHRVVRTDGTIGQYSLGGPATSGRSWPRRASTPTDGGGGREGVRYIGSDTTHVVCMPTCQHARRITPAHRVAFRSFGGGPAAGYRGCQVCRPDSGAIAA